MNLTETIRQGNAAVTRTASKNPIKLLADLIEDDPSASKDRLFKKWWATIKIDDSYLLAVARHAFTNMLHALDREANQPRHTKKEGAPTLDEVMDAQKRIIGASLLSLVLPKTNKTLADSTFAECATAGGWFSRVSKMGKPKEIVGTKLTNEDLQKI